MGTWNDERDALLRQWCAFGYSFGQIAQRFQEQGAAITRNSAIGRANRLGLAKPKQTQTITGTPRARIAVLKPKPKPIAAKPKPIPVLRDIELSPEESSFAVTFAKLAKHHCRYILDSGMYCGAPKVEDSSYCFRHHVLCYQPAKPRQSVALRGAA